MINTDSRLIELLTANEIMLLTLLASHMNAERRCWVGNKTMCKKLKWSMPRLQTTKKALVERDMIEVITRYKENDPGQTSNYYFIKTPLIQNYTPTIKHDTGGIMKVDTAPVTKHNTPGVMDCDTAHVIKHDNEVLTTEALANQPLVIKELEIDKYISLCKQYIFRDLIEYFFDTLDDYKDYLLYKYEAPTSLMKTKYQVDHTTEKMLIKLEGAAENIYESLKSQNRGRLDFREKAVGRRDDKKPEILDEFKHQVRAYLDYCRLTKTFTVKDIDKIPGKILFTDWVTELFNYVKPLIEKETYDPAIDAPQLLSDWLIEMYYYHPWDTYICKRYNNRIVSDGKEYLKN